MDSEHVPKTLSRSRRRLSRTSLSTALPNLMGTSSTTLTKEELEASEHSRKTEHRYKVWADSSDSQLRIMNFQTALCIAFFVLTATVMICKFATKWWRESLHLSQLLCLIIDWLSYSTTFYYGDISFILFYEFIPYMLLLDSLHVVLLMSFLTLLFWVLKKKYQLVCIMYVYIPNWNHKRDFHKPLPL